MTQGPVVSVVIPNFNGASTIDETLESIRVQTHQALEIIVVDDGSTDDSVAHVERQQEQDPRIRLLRQQNAGVAAARNLGWRSARSDLIAFVDSDDLWVPTKIARQVAALEAEGSEIGLVYCGHRVIDGDSRITSCEPCPTFDGDVLEQLMQGNFIGNGSAALVRRWVLERTAGFESALHRAGAQGCEDYLFYCRAAEHCRFAVVAEPLVGYRQLAHAMSADGRRMLRSWLMVLDELGARHPERRHLMERGFQFFAIWTTRRAVFRRNPWMVVRILAFLARRRPRLAGRIAFRVLPRLAVRETRKRIMKLWGRDRPESPADNALGTSFPAGRLA